MFLAVPIAVVIKTILLDWIDSKNEKTILNKRNVKKSKNISM